MLRAPMLRATVPFIAGLLIGDVTSIPLAIAWAVTLLAAALWGWGAYRRIGMESRWRRGLAAIPFLFAFGLLWQRLHAPAERSDDVARVAARSEGWAVSVLEIGSASARTVRAWGEVQAAFTDRGVQGASGRLLLTLLLDSTTRPPAVGDRLLVKAAAEPMDRTPDPGGFDQARWAAGYGVDHGCFAPVGRWCMIRRASGWPAWFEEARARVTAWLVRSGLPARERGLAKAVLLGVRDELDGDQRTDFARSGTMHVLAVSGSHVGIIYAAFLWGLAFAGRGRAGRWSRGLLVLLALWAYAGLTGFTPSVLRATVTFSVFTLAEMIGRRTEPVNSLAASAFLLLLWDPRMLGQLGFQLSFLAVLGIALFYRPLVHLWTPPHAVGRFFWSLLMVSLAAQVFTTPLSLLVFRAFPVWFLPANMVIVGLVSLGVYGGVLLVGLHAVPVLGPFIALLMEGLLRLLGAASAFFASLPFAYPSVRIDAWQCVGCYVLVLLLAGWVLQRWRWARAGASITMLLLLLSWGWSAHWTGRQRQFVVYDDREALTCALVHGRSMTVFTERRDDRTQRRVEQHRRACGLRTIAWVDSVPAAIRESRSSVVFLDGKRTGPAIGAPAVCVVRNCAPEGMAERIAAGTTVVLAPGMGRELRERWQAWCVEQGLYLHDMRRSGAYVRRDDR